MLLTKYCSYSDENYYGYIKNSSATHEIMIEIYLTIDIIDFCTYHNHNK